MQMPPPPVHKRKSNTGLIILIVAIAVCVPCILFMVFSAQVFRTFGGEVGEMANCSIAMQTLHKATESYAAENGGKLPPSKGWQTALKPYFKIDEDGKEAEEVPFLGIKMPDIGTALECSAKSKTGIAYNTDVAGKELKGITNKTTTMLFFEVPSVNMDQAQPYKDQDKSKAPSRIGTKGWLSISVDGTDYGFDSSSRRSRVKVQVGNEKEKDAPKADDSSF